MSKHIYLLKRPYEDVDYEEYDGFVVAASDPTEAKSYIKGGYVKDYSCEYLGKTSRKSGIILESFNAG